MPMGSQEKAANPEQFYSWAKKHIYDSYLVEYKLDGASLELQYKNGILQCAVTRGDGVIGDDITTNAKKMNGVMIAITKHGVPVDFTGGIRGEVIMTHDVHKNYFADKANIHFHCHLFVSLNHWQHYDNLLCLQNNFYEHHESL